MRIRALEWLGLPLSRLRYSSVLFLVTGAYLIVGVAAFAGWRITGNDDWVENFFDVPGALLASFLAMSGFWLSLRVLGHFATDEPMHAVWLCITGSAALDLVGTVASQVLSIPGALNPLSHMSWWSQQAPALLRQYGVLLSGTGRFAFLIVGLGLAIRVYRQNGLLARMKTVDWLALTVMGVYGFEEVREIVVASHKRAFPATEIAGWPVIFLLPLLLWQALSLYRSARQMGPGWISQCWIAMACGVSLDCVGVVLLWASTWGYLPWPWSSVVWYIWLPAGAAFALAPAYQLEAILRASAAPDTPEPRDN